MNNPLKDFIDQMCSIVQRLSELPNREEEGTLKRFWFPVCLVDRDREWEEVELSCTLRWEADLNYKICSDRWWRRQLCRWAHGDSEECGGREYIALKKNVKMIGKNFLQHAQQNFRVDKKRSYADFRGTREKMFFDSHTLLYLPVSLFPQNVLSERSLAFDRMSNARQQSECGFVSDAKIWEITRGYRETIVEYVQLPKIIDFSVGL